MQQAQAMFRGDAINATEQRAVLHVALRGSHIAKPPWGEYISQQVACELERVCIFAEKVRDGLKFDQWGVELGKKMAKDIEAFA
jgi:glucose-6-phosphate isomerase